MAYIVVVNPGILSTPGTGMPFSRRADRDGAHRLQMTLLMGLYARLPFAVAPGMGLNAFFAFTHRPAGQRAVADGARHGVLGRRAVPAGVGDAAARADRAGDSGGAARRQRRRHRAAADVHRPAQRRRSSPAIRRRWCAWARSITAPRSCCSASCIVAVLMRRNNPLAFLGHHRRGHRAGLGAGLRSAARDAGQRARFLVGVPALDILRRAAAVAAAGDRRDPLHRPVRLAVDVHRRRQRRRPDRRATAGRSTCAAA